MIPLHLTEPWSEAHPDRERIRQAAVGGYNKQDLSVLTEAFSGLPDNEKYNAWMYLTDQISFTMVDFAKYVHQACAGSLLMLHGINLSSDTTPGNRMLVQPFAPQMPAFVRMPEWRTPGANTQANKTKTDT